jgi:hypothetical protein
MFVPKVLPATPPLETVPIAVPVPLIPLVPATSTRAHVYITNLHKLVTSEELGRAITETTGLVPVSAEVIYIGPKSSGCADVELSDAEQAERVLALMNGHPIRSLAITATLNPLTPTDIHRAQFKNVSNNSQQQGSARGKTGVGMTSSI